MATTATMAKLEFGKLAAAWKGEASDFAPLLASQRGDLHAAGVRNPASELLPGGTLGAS